MAIDLNATANPVVKSILGSATLYDISFVPPPGVDLLDPESMLAFFNHQMRDVRAQLGIAMKDQTDRNQLANKIQQVEAKLSAFQDKGILPGDPEWDSFQKSAKEAVALLGASGAGSSLAAKLDQMAASGKDTKTFDSEADAKAYVKDHGGEAHKISVPYSDPVWAVGAAERDGNAVKSIVGELKAFRDGIQNDNSVGMIRVQQLVESSSQLTNLCSNIMKKLSDMAMAPINNMRG